MKSKAPSISISILFYLLLAIVFTYPLINHLSDSLPGTGNDGFVNLWNIDTFWTQINHGGNPFQTNRILYPLGTNLIFHGYVPIVSFLGFAFQNNLVLYLNLLMLLSFVLAALASNILTYYLTRNSVASFMAGLIFGFSPIMFSYLESQHYNFLFAAPFYPLSFLFCLLFCKTRKAKFLISLALTVFFCLMIDYYSAIMLITALVIATAITLIQKSFKFFLLFLLILFFTYLAANQIFQSYKNKLSPQTIYYADFCHTNIAGFFIPNTKNFFLSNISEKLHRNLSVERSLDTPSYYFGWIIFLIALISALKFRRNPIVQIMAVIFLTFFLLSLGTKIELGNLTLLSREQTPFFWFTRLPFLYLVDCPLRFPIAIQLPIVILVAFALKKIKPVYLFLPLAVFFWEYNYSGLDLNKAEIPHAYRQLAQAKDNRTLLELPGGLTESKKVFGYDFSIDGLNSKQMFWQTIHKKPRVGAYLSRIAPEKYQFFSTQPVISDLLLMTNLNGILPSRQYNSQEIASFINKFNLGYIILSPNSRQKLFEEIIDSWFKNYIKLKNSYDNFILYELLDTHSP